MQGVNVLGVSNPMQFPDDMDKDDIREFLRKRFAKQAVEGTQPVDLAPLQGQARAIEQSLAEKAGQGISNALYDSGIISDRYGAQRIGENVTSIGEFLPVIGDATAGDEFGRALKQGDGVGMALGALGAIPLVGDTAKKLSKIVDIERLKYDKLMTPLKAEFKLASAPRKEEIKIAAAELRKPLDAANSKLTIEKIRSRPKVKAAVEDVKPNKTFTGKGFHQTSSKFDEFDLNKSADGTAWFTNDINNFSDPASSSAAARGKGSIMERDIVLNKAAGYEELDKYSIGELKDQGYDGAILGGEIQVFDPKAIKTPSTNKAMGALGAIPLVGDAAKKGAKKAGKWYHGTNADFLEFDNKFLGSANPATDSKFGFYFGKKADTADAYREVTTKLNPDKYKSTYGRTVEEGEKRLATAKSKFSDMFGMSHDEYGKLGFRERRAANESIANIEAGAKQINNAKKELSPLTYEDYPYSLGDWVDEEKAGRIIEAELPTENMKEVDFGGQSWDEAKQSREARQAIDEGFDGVIFKDMQDSGWFGGSGVDDIALVFDSKKIKQLNKPLKN